MSEIPQIFDKTIKYLSSITFTLYLFHLPILDFVAAAIPYDKKSYLQVVPILIGIVFVVSLFAAITEKQRWRFKQLIEKLFNVFAH